MSALKADNDRLQRMMHVRPLNSSQNSIAHNRTSSESLERSLSITEQPSLGKKIRSTLEIQRCRISKCDDKLCYKRVRRSLLITFFFNTNWYWRWFYSVYLIIYQYQRLGHYIYQSDKLFYKADWFEIEKKKHVFNFVTFYFRNVIIRNSWQRWQTRDHDCVPWFKSRPT